MKIIQAVIFAGNIILLLVCNLYLWSFSWICGIGGLIGIIGFFIGYSISDGMTIAPRDYWRLPGIEVFKKKLAYGNSIAGGITVTVSFIIYAIMIAVTSVGQ